MLSIIQRSVLFISGFVLATLAVPSAFAQTQSGLDTITGVHNLPLAVEGKPVITLTDTGGTSATVTGPLTVTGAASAASVTASGAANAQTLNVSGAANAQSLNVSGASSTNTLNVTQTVTIPTATGTLNATSLSALVNLQGLAACAAGQVLTKTGSMTFSCVTPPTPGTCSAGQALTYTSGGFQCVAVDQAAIPTCSTGQYLSFDGTYFSCIAISTINVSCPANQVLTGISNGNPICAANGGANGASCAPPVASGSLGGYNISNVQFLPYGAYMSVPSGVQATSYYNDPAGYYWYLIGVCNNGAWFIPGGKAEVVDPTACTGNAGGWFSVAGGGGAIIEMMGTGSCSGGTN